MKVFIVSAMIIACAFAVPVENSMNNVFKFFGSCMESEDYATCLAVKGVTALNRAARAANIEILDGVSFVRDPAVPAERSGKALSENEIASTLPADPEEKSGRLLDLAMDSANKFVQTHTLQFKLPADAPEQVARSIEEGRGKIKKILKLKKPLKKMLVTVLPVLLIAVKLLVIKALITSKLAFLLVSFLMMKMGGGSSGGPLALLSKVIGGGGADASAAASTSTGWSSSAPAQYPYARSYDVAQEMAYGAQIPQQ